MILCKVHASIFYSGHGLLLDGEINLVEHVQNIFLKRIRQISKYILQKEAFFLNILNEYEFFS
jgi:hypothetical protein